MKALIAERFERGGLAFERITPAHGPELEPMMLDERVWRTLQDAHEPPPTPADVLRHAEGKHAHWEEHGFGQWVLRDPAGDGPVARGGLQYTSVTGGLEVEIGWAVLPARWGGGIATVLAQASVEAAFEQLGLEQLIAYTQPENIASRRVMEKAGFTPAGQVLHDGLPHLLYRLRAADSEPGQASA